MKTIRNMVMSFAIFYVLVILIVSFWTDFEEGYNIEEQYNKDGINVFEKLSQLNLIEGINNLEIGITKLIKLGGDGGDILGGLAAIGSGILQTIGGIVTFPLEIFQAIFGGPNVEGYYNNLVPSIISKLIGFIVVIAVGFILLSAKLGFEL